MTFAFIPDLRSMSGPERDHLQHIDDELTNVVRKGTSLAHENALNPDVVSNATVTVLLAVAAREALVIAEQTGQDIDGAAFERLARDVLTWATKRSAANRNGNTREQNAS